MSLCTSLILFLIRGNNNSPSLSVCYYRIHDFVTYCSTAEICGERRPVINTQMR